MDSSECLYDIFPKKTILYMKKKIKSSDLDLHPKQVGQSLHSKKDGVTTSFEVCDLSRLCNETITCDETSRNCATNAICATKNCAGTNNNCPISAKECNTYMGNCIQTGNKCPDTDADCQIYTEQLDCVTNTCAVISEACVIQTKENCEVLSMNCMTDETLIETKCECEEG
ncbi:MAG: hypothetical protein K2H00_05370 [Muribaculum intestinale]|nr:hypothetical protein [Muribaculum intestinale]